MKPQGLEIKAAAGLAHEAVIGDGALHRTQALAGGIDLVQGRPNRLDAR